MTDTRRIARERIKRLFELAAEIYDESPERADSYVERARKIGMRTRVPLPGELKRRVCPSCKSFLVYGDNARVRLQDGHVVVTCEECGEHKRYPYD